MLKKFNCRPEGGGHGAKYATAVWVNCAQIFKLKAHIKFALFYYDLSDE